MIISGVINEEGTQIHSMSFHPGEIDVINWLTDEEKMKLLEDREHVDSPSLPPYITVKPEKQGKLVWFSGPPGAGKSTTAQLLARNNGFVYYEADCLSMFVNPFIDIHTPNPSMAQLKQKPMKGITKDLTKAIALRNEMMKTIEEGNADGSMEKFGEIGYITAKEIKKQKERIGGDWAIALAILTRKQRDELRRILGPDLTFIVLNITLDCNNKRFIKRHGDNENTKRMVMKFENMIKKYEVAGDDEANAFNITITDEMTPEDVAKEATGILQR